MMPDQLPDSGADNAVTPAHLPAPLPSAALVLHRTQAALGLCDSKAKVPVKWPGLFYFSY